MVIRLILALCAIFGAVAVSQQQPWADGRVREELTDQELLELHRVEAAERVAYDDTAAVRDLIRKNHGDDDHHTVEIYDGYVIRTETEATK